MEDSHIYLAVSFQRHCSAAFTKQVIIINKNEFMWPPQKFENVMILSITSYIYKNKTKVTTWKFHYFQGCAVRKNCKEPSALYMWNPGCPAYDLCERTEIFKLHGSKSCRRQVPLGSAIAQPWLLQCWCSYSAEF